MIKLIWKGLIHRKFQSIAVAVTIALGVGIVFCIALMLRGVSDGLELSKQRMGADIVVVPRDVGISIDPSVMLFGGATENTYMPESVAGSIRSLKGVVSASPQFFTRKLSADCHDIGPAIRMAGYDAGSDWVIKPWLKKANINALADDDIILGSKVITWNQNYIFILGKQYNIASIAEETGTTLDYSIFVNMAEARRVAAKSEDLKKIWTRQGAPEQLISAVLVRVDPAEPMEDIVDEINKTGFVQPLVAAAVKHKIQQQFEVLGWLLGGAGVLTVLAALVQIFARFFSLTLERQAEWGLYLALGASGKKIAGLVLGEAVVISFIGSFSGLLLGGLLYAATLSLLAAYQAFPFISPDWFFIIAVSISLLLGFIGLGCVAAWLPAYRGSRIPPGTVMLRGEFG